MPDMTTIDHPVTRFTGTHATVDVFLTVHARSSDGSEFRRDVLDQDDIDHAMTLVSAWAASRADKSHAAA